MKSLSIIRHAKAAPPEKYATDFERPLTKRGVKDIKEIAKIDANLKPAVDWIISSPAARTRETTLILAESLGYTKTIQWEERAYLAEAEQWLELLRNIPPDMEHVLVVGHNPGLSDLAAGLVAGAASYLNLHLPTAALAYLELEIFWWNQIRWGCGRLHLLLPPKPLR
ncbi:MAG: histidine phosphatase family protein [Caldilineaceae bacterium]